MSDFLDDDLEDDILGDDLDDDLEDDGLEADYAVSDQEVRALSGERGAALDRPKILGSAVRLEDGGESSLEKLLRGGSAIELITVKFANGRKLYIKP